MTTPMKNRMRFTACNWEVLRDNGSSLVAVRKGYPWNERRFGGAVAQSIRSANDRLTMMQRRNAGTNI